MVLTQHQWPRHPGRPILPVSDPHNLVVATKVAPTRNGPAEQQLRRSRFSGDCCAPPRTPQPQAGLRVEPTGARRREVQSVGVGGAVASPRLHVLFSLWRAALQSLWVSLAFVSLCCTAGRTGLVLGFPHTRIVLLRSESPCGCGRFPLQTRRCAPRLIVLHATLGLSYPRVVMLRGESYCRAP